MKNVDIVVNHKELEKFMTKNKIIPDSTIFISECSIIDMFEDKHVMGSNLPTEIIAVAKSYTEIICDNPLIMKLH